MAFLGEKFSNLRETRKSSDTKFVRLTGTPGTGLARANRERGALWDRCIFPTTPRAPSPYNRDGRLATTFVRLTY